MGALEKLAIVGAGSVGAAVAYAATIDRVADAIALYDRDGARAAAEALDLSHGLQFVGGGRVTGGDDIELCRGADLVVVTAGAAQRPGDSRLDLAAANVKMVEQLLPALLGVAPEAIYLFVTNPVDIVTFVAQEVSGLPRSRVIGSGTVLDSSRLRHVLAERLGLSVTSIHALVVGEHGDSEIVLWSSATVAGTPLLDVVGPDGRRIRPEDLDDIHREVRGAAARIIAGKGNTNLAIGLATGRIVRAISRDEHAVLPVSVRRTSDDNDVCLSVPSVVGRLGVLATMPLTLDAAERDGLAASASALGRVLHDVWSPS